LEGKIEGKGKKKSKQALSSKQTSDIWGKGKTQIGSTMQGKKCYYYVIASRNIAPLPELSAKLMI
jgi:hypothetical protein